MQLLEVKKEKKVALPEKKIKVIGLITGPSD